MRRSLGLILAVALTGCGSAATLPPPAQRADSPPVVEQPPGVLLEPGQPLVRGPVRFRPAPVDAELDPRARVVRFKGAEADAGVGPTRVATTDDYVYVTDTTQGTLLVYRKEPELALERRKYLPGSPYALVVDEARERLWVSLTAFNEVVGLTLDDLVKEQERLPTVRQPDVMALDRGGLVIRGSDRVQVLLDADLRDLTR